MRNLWARLRTPRWRLAVALGVVAAAAFAIVAIASHVPPTLSGSTFEIDADANLKVDHATGTIDWASVSETRKADTQSGSTDESFGQGTKEDTAAPSVVDGGIPPNKSDLKFFGVYQEGSTATGFLNLYWSRVQEPSGTTNMDFELNKRVCTPSNPVTPPTDADCSANGLTPIRSEGDFLVQYDLSQGGTNPVLFVSRWVTTGNKSQCEAANAVPCWGTKQNLSLSGDAAGSINTAVIPNADSDDLGEHSSRTFGEAQLRLSAILGTSGCTSIGSAYLKSRSSDSFTAALKDFVPPAAVSITNCGTVNITKTDDSTPANALNNAVFTLYTDNAPLDGAAPHGAEDTATSPALSCTTSGTGVNAGKCSISNVPFGQYWIVETTVPTGYTAAADQNVIISAQSPTANVSFVDVRQKGSLTVHKEDDDGNLMGGVKFTLKGTSDFGTAVDKECTTASSGADEGECTFSNIEIGSYTLDEDETTLPAGYTKDSSLPKTVAITTDPNDDTVNIENPRTHRIIVLVCHEGTDELDSFGVTLGATTKQSISGVPSSVSGKTPAVTEKELCDLGGASFGGLDHDDANPQTLGVNLGSH